MKHENTEAWPRGEKCHTAKLTEAEVRAIRASSDKQEYLAGLYGVSRITIQKVKSRRTWKHVP